MNNHLHPCIWFNGNAKEAAELYCSVFPDSNITVDTPMVVNFELNGQKFMGLNGGPMYSPTPAVSFFVVCETEEEVEKAWARLQEGGSVLMPLDKYDWSEKYAWVQDKFGVNWQLAYGKLAEVGQKFTPTLMFTNERSGTAEQAMQFYTSVFDNSSVVGVLRYKEANELGAVVQHAQFKLNGNVFMAMDSPVAHAFTFSEGNSFVIECDTQEEIDYYWTKLSEGGHEDRCGWLKDRHGVSWQVVPKVLSKLMTDRERAPRVLQAFMKMKKFDIETLVNA